MKFLILIFAMTTIAMTAPGQQDTEEPVYICPPCGNSCDLHKYSQPGICAHCGMALIREDKVKTIAFYLQNGVEVLDFAGPMEVFAYAGYRVFTVSKTKDPIKSQGILSVIPDYSIEDAPRADILAFFGGNAGSAFRDPEVINWIKNQQDVHFHFSVCTGAFLLAEAGILNGKTATTFHESLDNLERNYPEVDVRRDVRFVDNGTVITTAGISAGIDGALHLVAKLQGINVARRTAYYMEYDNWVPGEGLILSKDNPYGFATALEDLKAYVGKYEFRDNGQLEIVLDQRTKGLNVVIDRVAYPLFQERGDVFTDKDGGAVVFQRTSLGQVSGYQIGSNDRLYQKLAGIEN